jgi:hypothetical protein
MSTCPRCKGHLTETHQCPRRPARIVAEVAAAAAGGGLVALLAVAWFDPHGRLAQVDAIATAIGILVGIGVDRLLRG